MTTSIYFIAAAGISAVTALAFLALSISPAGFRYIMPAHDLLDYAERLDEYEHRRVERGDASAIDALSALKRTLAREYAASNQQNRLIIHRRGRWRAIAGLAMLIGVLAIIALVSVSTAYCILTG